MCIKRIEIIINIVYLNGTLLDRTGALGSTETIMVWILDNKSRRYIRWQRECNNMIQTTLSTDCCKNFCVVFSFLLLFQNRFYCIFSHSLGLTQCVYVCVYPHSCIFWFPQQQTNERSISRANKSSCRFYYYLFGI